MHILFGSRTERFGLTHFILPSMLLPHFCPLTLSVSTIGDLRAAVRLLNGVFQGKASVWIY